MALYPLLLNPALHTKVWGGRQLEIVMGKALPTDEPYGEAWEMHDTAVVANGPLQGRTLGDILAEYGHELVGPDNDPAVGLPLLAKIIDAADWLSVQLHPNDEQARQLEGEPRGKTEAWYVLAAKPGARLVIGVKPGTTREQMAQAIRENTLESLLVYAEVRAGDVLFVSSGTIHALGEGVLVYEIQQSSDTTYRLYDWGRMGLDGKPRALHIEKGTQVANMESLPTIIHTGDNPAKIVDIVESPYFKTVLYQLNETNGTQIDLDTEGRRFIILTCIEGEVKVSVEVTMKSGQTVLVPACQGQFTLSGTARVLSSSQP
jgi:mannose-6-phosphate isomerase